MSAAEADSESVSHEVVYGEAATKLVVDGLWNINSRFADMKRVKRFPAGEVLKNVVYSTMWEMPNLMSGVKYETFREVSKKYNPEDSLIAIEYILKNVCKEASLKPYIILDGATGKAVVRLQ